jgi:hypothetical protein
LSAIVRLRGEASAPVPISVAIGRRGRATLDQHRAQHRRERPSCGSFSAADQLKALNRWIGRFWRSQLRAGLGLAASVALAFAASASRAAETPLTVEQLLAQGWEIAGYASGYDNRTSLILFRHPGVNALVQCGVLYDVTRNPRTILNCYELH